jgi:uncharacterized protein (TIGR02453 family)
LLEPAKAFVTAQGDELRSRVSPLIRAEPRVKGSILRINRDTRFSSDKRPYEGHLDLMFWEGERHSRESPGFFIRLRPWRVGLGAGMHRFDRGALEAYRAAVLEGTHRPEAYRAAALDERTGPALEDAVARATGRT